MHYMLLDQYINYQAHNIEMIILYIYKIHFEKIRKGSFFLPGGSIGHSGSFELGIFFKCLNQVITIIALQNVCILYIFMLSLSGLGDIYEDECFKGH